MSSPPLDSLPHGVNEKNVGVTTHPPVGEITDEVHNRLNLEENPRTVPAGAGSVEPPDPHAMGKAKLAEFWPTYVKEADLYDKELSDGWNKMLDVILIFAALFSAISTAFVLESSKDLKPDSSESAAATLLIISQTLLAMSNQSSASSIATPTEPPTFKPTASAVAVNLLWFASLILSVSVTLVAMLAKEWSHVYMIGRYGVAQEQALRRQKRFDAMEAWKMPGVITALPTLMHLALFLFAAGLCIYLWNIHIGVAVPVVLLTLATVLLYLASLMLPLIYDFCPYATALSKLIKPYLSKWFKWRKEQGDAKGSDGSVPMDENTSRTLAWLISNSEIPASVDICLQAIAGTSYNLPNAVLHESNAPRSIYRRLRACLGLSFYGRKITAADISGIEESDPPGFASVLVYTQALILIHPYHQENAELYTNGDKSDYDYLLSQLGDLHDCLCVHKSLPISAIGYAVGALANERTYSRPSRLLDLSQHIVHISEQQGSFPTDRHLSNLLCALHREGARWYPWADLIAQMPQILRNMLDIINSVHQAGLAPEVSRELLIVALALNRDAATTLGGVATRFSRSTTPAQQVLLYKPSNLLLSLAITGILGALELHHLFDDIQVSKLDLLFTLLLAQPDYIRSTEQPLLSEDPGITIGRCITETVFACQQQLAQREANIADVEKIVCYGLAGTAEPWCILIVTTVLEQSDSDNLRHACVSFIAQNEPKSIGLGLDLLFTAVYEAVRLEIPGRTDIQLHVYARDVLRLTQHFGTISPADRRDTQEMVQTLLRRLIQDDLFASLLIRVFRASSEGPSFHASSEGSSHAPSESPLNNWRGRQVGYTMQFWGEHIVQFGRMILNGNGKERGDVAEKMRAFFETEQELTDVREVVTEGVKDLKALLWHEINRTDDPTTTLTGRMSWWTRVFLRTRSTEEDAGQALVESV